LIKHNANIWKWWHDPKAKLDYKQASTELIKYVLDNREKTVIQILKYKEEVMMKKGMESIRRIMTQIEICDRETDREEQILGYQCFLAT
jgi:hypothetical protein